MSSGPGTFWTSLHGKKPICPGRMCWCGLDGKISFPLLNDVQAAGVTTGDLKKTIEEGLKAYVSHPVVTVGVKSPTSQRFYVLGEVLAQANTRLSRT